MIRGLELEMVKFFGLPNGVEGYLILRDWSSLIKVWFRHHKRIPALLNV